MKVHEWNAPALKSYAEMKLARQDGSPVREVHLPFLRGVVELVERERELLSIIRRLRVAVELIYPLDLTTRGRDVFESIFESVREDA